MFETICLFLYLALSIIGYKKNNKNLLLSASPILLIGLGGANFIAGFIEGFNHIDQT